MIDDPIVFFNGHLVPANEVNMSPFDLGLTVGLGVFETMAAYRGKVFAYNDHYQRLEKSAASLGIIIPSVTLVETVISSVIEANGLSSERARIRISVSGGVNPLTGGDAEGCFLLTAVSAPMPQDYAKLIISSSKVNEVSKLTSVKSASYAENVMAYREAISQDADEAVMMNRRDQLSECSMSNLFLVKDGAVVTPSLASGCLAGVTRSKVIALCKELHIPILECDLDIEDLHSADEVFITSSLREVQSAGFPDKGEGLSFPLTDRLKAAYRALIF